MEEKVKKEYFTRISSITLENLARVLLNPNEWRTVMALIRKTYGYKKVKDRISLSQFQSLTGLDRKNQSKALKSLEKKGVILKEKAYINSYSVNKDYAEWIVAGQPPGMTHEEKDKLVVFKSELVVPEGQSLVVTPPHTIDNTIDILQDKENTQKSEPDDTASACASAGITDEKGLRSVEDIRKEHPDAKKVPSGTTGGQWIATWKDPSKKNGAGYERCS